MSTIVKKFGLLLGDEEDWPSTLEALIDHWRPVINYRGQRYEIQIERIRIHPFSLRASTDYHLVVDRLAYWHYQPREWLKKVAMLNRVYLLNNPFTFQSMEKHTAYCAMMRLGLPIPDTWLIPPKLPPTGYVEKFQRTAAKYHDWFDLQAIGKELGYPLYMKPFDGGGWRGVSRIDSGESLQEAYDSSGPTVMHLQQGLDDFDVFARALTIGPQAMIMRYDPSRPMHDRYQVEHGFLDAEHGKEAQIVTKTINAFFRWEFNSCESILKNGVLYPIDFANACPDVALTSLHYYFPQAMKSLLKWSIFCAVTERPMRIAIDDLPQYFAVADSDRSYTEKLAEYEKLADIYFDTEHFNEFAAEHLTGLDEAMFELVQGPRFDEILVNTVRSTFPRHEQEAFIAHYRGLLWHWVTSETAKNV